MTYLKIMKNKTQKEVWNNIAEDWNSWKTTPDPRVSDFVKNSEGKLLDLGCGSGRNFVVTSAKIYGIDFSEKMIKYANKKAESIGINYECIVGDADRLPYENNFFDNVIAIAVIHCIEGEENRDKTIKEIYRVLKKKGKIFIKVWNKNHIRFEKKGKEKFVKWLDKGERYYYFYEENELKRKLENAGFKIINSSSKSGDKTDDEIVIIAEKI